MKPEYLFRPSQIWHRILRARSRPESAEVVVPWNLPMRIRPRESVGHSLWHLGVLDLVVSEILWRLAEPGCVAVDAGANIGFYSGLLSLRAGPSGRVHAFEPHPGIAEEFRSNEALWQRHRARMAPVALHQTALSNHAGRAPLFEPGQFDHNRGTASLEAVSSETGRANAEAGHRWDVDLVRLDSIIPSDGRLDLLKVDVEGHELAVFEGAGEWIAEGRIRDIVFEEHNRFPSAAMQSLERAGYSLFLIGRSFWGPMLLSPERLRSVPHWLPPNLLATRDPDRAVAACRPRGWRCLRG